MFAPRIKTNTPPQPFAGLSKISIPLIRKVYPKLIAQQLVAVQPMSGPASLALYMRYRYASRISFDNVYYAIVDIKRDELILSRDIEIPGVECVLTKKLSDKVFAVVFEDGKVRRFSRYTVNDNLITIKMKRIKRNHVRTGQTHQDINEQEVVTN